MEVILANPRGFCAGVERAVATVELLLDRAAEPVFVRHEIVHNRVVVERLAARGAIFVDDTAAIPEGAVAVLSAHGVAPAVLAEADARQLRVVDATCPLVTKVQLEVQRQARSGRSVIIIGHRGHVEVDGLIGHFVATGDAIVAVVETIGEADTVTVPDAARVAWVTQTTLAVDEARRIVERLRTRFPALVDPHGETICYATQNRQDAVRALARVTDVVLVIGAPHSSNSCRLVEVVGEAGGIAHLIEGPRDVSMTWFAGVDRMGLTASASAPEILVDATLDWLRERFPGLVVASLGAPETIHFNLPPAVRHLLKENPAMPDINAVSTSTRPQSDSSLGTGIDNLLDAAADIAGRLREAAEDAGLVATGQLSRLVEAGGKVRDRNVSDKLLAEARQRPVTRELRSAAHGIVDLGVDATAVAFEAGFDALDQLLRRKPVGAQLAA